MKINLFFAMTILSVISCSSSSSDSDEDNVTNNPTSNEFRDNRDENVYKTVKIGNQIWMAENLRYLPNVSPPNFTSRATKYNYVNGYFNTITDEAKQSLNYKTYGVLYNWTSAMNGEMSSDANPSTKQCLCPDGWHLPSKAEYLELKSYLENNKYGFDGNNQFIGKSLASKTLWNTLADIGAIGNELEKNNSSGFNALPAGTKLGSNGKFSETGERIAFWTSSEATANESTNFLLTNTGKGFYFGDNDKSAGFSIRCVKD